jgi:hypothetical protein
MPWHQQINPARVAELRTVSGSRYEFVERENRMFLEYRAKPGAYRIVCENPSANDKNTCEEDVKGENRFSFRVSNGFGEVENGLGVSMNTISPTIGNYLYDSEPPSSSYFTSTDDQGKFRVRLDDDPLPPDGDVWVNVRVGNTTQKFRLDGTAKPDPGPPHPNRTSAPPRSASLSPPLTAAILPKVPICIPQPS